MKPQPVLLLLLPDVAVQTAHSTTLLHILYKTRGLEIGTLKEQAAAIIQCAA